MHGWTSTIPSFAEWWDVYRKTYTPLKSARNLDAQIVAHFLPHFGAGRLDEITKSDIVRYLNLRRTQMTGNPGHKTRRLVSESTVRRERGLLQSIFERAIDEGYDIRNPFRGIKRGKDKPRTRVLTLAEETLLLDALHPRFQRFVRFALETGYRLDEIRGIETSSSRGSAPNPGSVARGGPFAPLRSLARDVNWHSGLSLAAPIIFTITRFSSLYAHPWKMKALDRYLDEWLGRGRRGSIS